MVSLGPVNKLALLSLQSFLSLYFLLSFLVTFDLKPLLLMRCGHLPRSDIQNIEL